MKPECLECEATLTLALERVKRLEEALREVVKAARAELTDNEALDRVYAIAANALRPEGT